MKTKTYFIRANLGVDSADESLKSTLRTGYNGEKTTFAFLPIKVMHQYYENEQIRKACNVVKKEEIELKKSIFPYNIKCPKEVGVGVTLTLNSGSETVNESKSGPSKSVSSKSEAKEATKKRLRLFVCKTNTTLNKIIDDLIKIKTWEIEGTTY